MKRERRKKSIALVLIGAMLLTMNLGVTAFAEEGEPINEVKTTACGLADGCTLENGHEGDCIVEPEMTDEVMEADGEKSGEPAGDKINETRVVKKSQSEPARVAAKQTYVAKSGDAQYATLQEAFDTAENNSEIELTTNINDFKTSDIATVPAEKTFVLNMAGHSMEAASDFTGRFIVNEGNLTVTGNGTMDASASSKGGYGAINNKGMLTIENGTYRGAIHASGSAIRNTGADAVLTIKDGVFEEATCAIYNEGTATLEDGTYTGATCSQCNSSIWSYTIRNTTEASKMTIEGGTYTGVQGAVSASVGYLEVNDGTFKSVKCQQNPSHTATFYALYAAGEVGKVKCIINNGHFETEGNIAAVVVGNDNTGGDGGINAEATAVIKNGTFVAPEGVPALKGAAKTGDPQILGGTFSSDVSKYLPSGMKQDETGKVVVNENAVAKIDDALYATLADAIAAVKDGETITLTKDVPEAEGIVVPSGKNFTIDFDEHTYTLAGPGVGSTNTETNGFQLLQDSTIVFKNGTINYKEGQTKIKRMFQSYADVTFENMDFYTEHQSKAGSQPTAEHYAFSFCNGTIVFTGDTNIISADKNAVSFIAGNFQDYPATHVSFDEKFTGSVNSVMEYSGPNTENYSMVIKGDGTFGGFKTTKGDDPNGFNIYSGTFTTTDCLEYLGENANVNIKLDTNVDHGITIPENTTVNLDLNGKTITGDELNAAIRNEGTLTIEDKSAEKTGVVKRQDTENSASYYVVDNQGTMTIKGGTYENNSGKLKDEETQTWTGSSLVRNGGEKEAVLNISGGTFKQDKFIVIKNDDHGTLNMTGGHLVTKNPAASAIQNWAEATVTGGKVDGMIWTATWSNDLPDAITNLGGDVEVVGEIRAGYAGGSSYANDKNSNVIINGGTYDSKFTTQTPTGQTEGKGTKIEVIKGSFTNDTVVPYMTEGNAALFTEGNYLVMPEKDAVKKAVAYVEVEGKRIYLTDKEDADEVVGNDDKPEIQDTTDYDGLANLVKEYERLDKSSYTKDSFAKFEAVLKKANTVLTDKNSTQSEVDALIEELKTAKEQLVKINPNTGSQGETSDTTDKGNGGDSASKEKTDAVKTGDTANIGVYITVMALAAGMAAVALRRKHRE